MITAQNSDTLEVRHSGLRTPFFIYHPGCHRTAVNTPGNSEWALTLDAMHNFEKIKNLRTNADLENQRGSWKEWLPKRKNSDLRLSRNGCSRKTWSVKAGIMELGHTLYGKVEK